MVHAPVMRIRTLFPVSPNRCKTGFSPRRRQPTLFLGRGFRDERADCKPHDSPKANRNVGLGPAKTPTSHFVAENLHGEIIVIEIPDGDPSKSKIYIGPQLFGDNADLTPVTLSFKDVNGDGKPDMLMHVQDQTIIFLNDGTQFKTPKQ